MEPKRHQLPELIKALGANRFVWNKLLAMNLNRLAHQLPLIWYQEMAWFITLWKQSEEFGFLRKAPSQSLQQTAKALDRAFRDAFDKTQPNKRIPVFKRLGKNEAGVKYPQGTSLDSKNKVIQFPKLGFVKYRHSRDIKGQIKTITISRSGQKMNVSIQALQEVEPPIHSSQSAVGIDLGIVRFATLSNGEVIEPINSYRTQQEKLAKEQRKLKNKTKFSSNWKKQQLKIAKTHQKIAQARADFLHKTSTHISKNHAIVVLEDLKVANMSKSAKGSLEAPGKQVSAKSGLNKSILDQGWSQFRRQLEYKQGWNGGMVVVVSPQYTSQTCPNCHHVERANRKTQAHFCCMYCSYEDHADLVGAINILRAGHAQLACEVSV